MYVLGTSVFSHCFESFLFYVMALLYVLYMVLSIFFENDDYVSTCFMAFGGVVMVSTLGFLLSCFILVF